MGPNAKPAVLLLHNRYRRPGGEERAVAAMIDLLRARGHEVGLLERSSEELAGLPGRSRGAISMLRGGLDPGAVARAVERTGAQVVHAHNINPLLGPRALRAARAAGARVVMHLHNYRLFCAIAIGYRDGELCTRCRGRNTLPGIRLRCRGSLPEAVVYATALARQQPAILRLVDHFVVPSRAAAARLAEFGMPTQRISVLHNFVPAGELADSSSAAQGEQALYAGRLAEEKGVDTAIEAARRSGIPLIVAGEGPDEGRLRRLAAGAPVSFTGRLAADELAQLRRRSALALVPSRWDEPCPYSVIEAMAAGVPVLASRVGGLPEMVGDEAALDPRSPSSWAAAVEDLWSNEEGRRHAGEQALARARELFSEDRFYAGLMDVYARAAEVRERDPR